MKTMFIKIIAISFLVGSITFLHYQSDPLEIYRHILFRELYFVPIIFAGFWFGMTGALSASVTITLLYLPYVLMQPEGIDGHNFGNLMQIILFNVIALIIGWLKNRDIKQQKKILDAKNLAAMGKAVSCIAHDMKTPLVAIGGFVQQVRRNLSNEDKAARKLDVVLEQTHRLELLVKDMLAFSKPLELDKKCGDLNQFLQDVLLIAEEKSKHHGVRLLVELESGLDVCIYDTHRLQQAVLNLLSNAVEASPQGSEVILRSGQDDKSIVIEVEDHGEGISEERIQEVSQPFVSSKKEGTGLGLPIIHKVAEAHGGSLQLLRKQEEGVIARLFLPK